MISGHILVKIFAVFLYDFLQNESQLMECIAIIKKTISEFKK